MTKGRNSYEHFNPAIHIENLRYTYGRAEAIHLSLKIQPDRCCGLFGRRWGR